MSGSHKLSITIPDKLFAELERYRKSTKTESRSAAVVKLLNYAVAFPSYFKDFDWKKAEVEADRAIQGGEVKTFTPVWTNSSSI